MLEGFGCGTYDEDEAAFVCHFPTMLENSRHSQDIETETTEATASFGEERDEPWLIYDPCFTKLQKDREATITYLQVTPTNILRNTSISRLEKQATNLIEDSLFEILNTQYSYEETDGLVLSPDIMEGIQSHLPTIKRGESFWLQYSLVRDGANMECLLSKTRKVEHSVLAIETVDGEKFGAYCSNKWELHSDFFGGRDAFLWRINKDSIEEDDLEVFHYSHLNEDVQLCTHTQLAVGGGIKKLDPSYGFGISLDEDLQKGTTNNCLTFCSPPLSQKHSDGTYFEIRNIEIWALTPYLSLEDAERVQNRSWTHT